MQGLRFLLGRGIETRVGTDGKRRPGTIALGLGLAHPTPLTLKRDRTFTGLHDSSCCVTTLMDSWALGTGEDSGSDPGDAAPIFPALWSVTDAGEGSYAGCCVLKP